MRRRGFGEHSQIATTGTPARTSWRSRRLVLAVTIAVLLVASGCSAPSDDQLATQTTISGVFLADSTSGDPIVLKQDAVPILASVVTNVSDEPVTVEDVRLRGKLLELTFLHYNTAVGLDLAPGESDTIRFPFDFFDLDEQARGLLAAELTFHGNNAELLSTERGVLDVRGNALSTMGWFSLLVAATAFLSLAFAFYAVARGRQSFNRGARGLRLAVSGAALGLAMAIASHFLSIAVLSRLTWIALIAVGALVGFAIGYLLPNPPESPAPDRLGDDPDRGADDRPRRDVDLVTAGASSGGVAESPRIIRGGAAITTVTGTAAVAAARSEGESPSTPDERRQRATRPGGTGEADPDERRKRATAIDDDTDRDDSEPDDDPNRTVT